MVQIYNHRDEELANGLESECVEVSVKVSDVEHAVGDRSGTIEDGTFGGVFIGKERLPGGGVEDDHSGAILNYDNTGHHCDGREHSSICQTMLPQKRPCSRIEGSHISATFGTIDGCAATCYIEPGAIPGAGRDATLAALGAATPSGNFPCPDWTPADSPTNKGIISAIFVCNAD